MLAGRKLLLADDSATIQKVIDLTFADEGVRVMAVSNGQEALERLLEFGPDVVLADVFMPSPNGYEICEYIKTNEKLKHIPVMLLVGSFEPFDEAEARRVGADDILTKPFQSIRRLIDRVGALVSSPPVESDVKREGPTAELPRTEEEPVEEPRLSTDELEVTTADTMPLPGSMLVDTLPRVEKPVVANEVASSEASFHELSQYEETSEQEGSMEPGIPKSQNESSDMLQGESSDVLLDLGELEPVSAASSDDFVLELDDVPAGEVAPAYSAAPMRAFVEPEVREAPALAYESNYRPDVQSAFAETQEIPYASYESASTFESTSVPPELTPDPVPVFGETEFPVAGSSSSTDTGHALSADRLSPEMIDAIARRAVELMSDKVIREIAWEVVPDLAELLIKRQLEERQAK